MEAGSHIEAFLVSSVATILIIRGYLHLTGYPQLGDDDLHIAHMLWGGLLMLASMLILLTFLGKTAKSLAVIIGGVGFGTFIDEVGKFVTQDHNYFFEPSVAIIYAIFILIFLTSRAIRTRRQYSQAEYLMNAIRDLEEIALHDLDQIEKNQILEYLNRSNPNNPLVSELKEALEHANLVPTPSPGLLVRLKSSLQSCYARIISFRLFYLIVLCFFLFQMIASFSYVIVLVVSDEHQTLAWVEWAQFLSSFASAIFVLAGMVSLRKSRLTAFRMFERAILISIFFTQVFVFYEEQFSGLVGLAIDLLILIALGFMIEMERHTSPKAE
jgi:hypothetical protein